MTYNGSQRRTRNQIFFNLSACAWMDNDSILPFLWQCQSFYCFFNNNTKLVGVFVYVIGVQMSYLIFHVYLWAARWVLVWKKAQRKSSSPVRTSPILHVRDVKTRRVFLWRVCDLDFTPFLLHRTVYHKMFQTHHIAASTRYILWLILCFLFSPFLFFSLSLTAGDTLNTPLYRFVIVALSLYIFATNKQQNSRFTGNFGMLLLLKSELWRICKFWCL